MKPSLIDIRVRGRGGRGGTGRREQGTPVTVAVDSKAKSRLTLCETICEGGHSSPVLGVTAGVAGRARSVRAEAEVPFDGASERQESAGD
jgi:hypothetical protein